jgi:hypothetical protein
MNYVPISGLIDSTDVNGPLLALRGLVSDSALLAPPTIGGSQFQSDTVTVDSISVSADMLASLDFRGFSMTAQGNAVYFLQDVTATTTVPVNNPASPIAGWVIGVGVRMAIRGLNVQSNASLSVASLAASATLNATATAFEVQTIGIGLPALPILKGLVNQSIRGFDVSTMAEVGNVVNELIAFLANPANATQIQPQVVGVNFATGSQVQSAAATYGFALWCVQKGNTLSWAQTNPPVFRMAFPSIQPSSRPSTITWSAAARRPPHRLHRDSLRNS